jgi:hypothetical protein
MAKAKKRPAEAWTYVLEADRTLDPSEQSRFTLSPMTYAQRAAVRDAMTLGGRVYESAGEIAVKHIVSIENFPAGNSQPWPSDREERRRYLELLDDDAVLELGNEVWRRSTLGVDEEAVKNSSTPERTSSSGDTSAKTSSSTPVGVATPIPA